MEEMCINGLTIEDTLGYQEARDRATVCEEWLVAQVPEATECEE